MYNPEIHHRKSVRQKNHDYSIGSYYITLATNHRLPLFGRVRNEQMELNDAGLMIQRTWLGIPVQFPNVVLDAFIVMPEHFHGIIDLNPDRNGATTLPGIIQYFKSWTTVQYIHGVRNNHWQSFEQRLWQRNYFERGIRDMDDLLRARDYVYHNPVDYRRKMYGDSISFEP